MEVILLKDVEKLGAKGDVASVSDGYARNFLFPRGLAEVATPGKIEAAKQAMQAKLDQERREAEQALDTRETLARTVLTIPAAAGQGEKLFGSVTNADVAAALWSARKIRIDKRKVLLEDPIKTLGTHMVLVDVHQSVEPVEMKVIIVPADS